jgi:CRP/FNR family cyclic AMP-dependent transcriptional regulator
MPSADLAHALLNYLDVLRDSPRDIVAHGGAAIGAALVVAGAFVRTMIPLRWLAVGGNLGFLVFGALHPQPVTFCVAAVLLPINLYRAREMMRLTRRVAAARSAGDQSGLWLQPYMKPRKFKAGHTLFAKGDDADLLYLLVEGRLQLVEIGRELAPGRIFGEIALFSPDKRRTFTARCLSDCTVLTIDEATVNQLFHQNPAFGFHLTALIAARLSEDVGRSIGQRLQPVAGDDGTG